MRKRVLELVLILGAVALISLAWPRPEKPPEDPPVTLRWSVQGGRGNDTAYFFELRGPQWQAVLAGPGSGSRRLRGLLSQAEVRDLVRDVEACPTVWESASSGSVWFGSGPSYPFYFERGGRITHRPDLVRSSLSEQQLVVKLSTGLPGKVKSSLERMRTPGGLRYAPAPDWPLAPLDAGGPRATLY